MPNPWLALEIGADPAERIHTLRRAHAEFVGAGPDPIGLDTLRPVVTESWERSARARVDPDGTAPIDIADAELEEYRRSHPLALVMPLFRELLGGIAQDGEHLMAVCDQHGRLLWVEGHTEIRRQAERMNFLAGAQWDEGHAGTNAPGTALAVDHAVQIFAAEHYSRSVQPWTCAAAPIHDPRSGALLGAIDITGGDHLANPHSLALVQATARAAEGLLATVLAGWEVEPATGASLAGLGRDEAVLTVAGRPLVLSRRHSEIVMILAGRPAGLTGDQLGLELHGDELNPVTLRAELSRLRRVLGPELLDSRPYRLRLPVRTDAGTVRRLLDQGAVREALAAYRGPLLPQSEAPAIVRLRRRLDSDLRASVLASADALLLEQWTASPWGAEDLNMWEALLPLLSASSLRRTLVVQRIGELTMEYASPRPVPLGSRARAARATSAQRPAH